MRSSCLITVSLTFCIISVCLFKDLEEMDEDALLAGSDDEAYLPGTSQTNVSQSLLHPEFDVNEEELIKLEVEDPDYLEE